MSQSLEEYKAFIDGLVSRKASAEAARVSAGVWHEEPQLEGIPRNELLAALSQQQRDVIADMLQEAREGGIHDVLVLLTDGEYRLVRHDTELAWEPFGTEIYFDFVARSAGDEWPDERD